MAENDVAFDEHFVAMIKSRFDPMFDLLFEHQRKILALLEPSANRTAMTSPLTRLEKLEVDVDLLKIVIRQMREEIDQLKGA